MGSKVRFFVTYAVFLSVSLASTASAEEMILTVSEKNCARIEKHIAKADVTYKGGVDVRGNAVASADLNQNQLQLPESVTIDLSLPLHDLFSLANPPSRKLQNAEVHVGTLEYNLGSGKLTFNGQELADPALHAISEKCKEIYRK
ncbi:hypothetical protein A9Q83_12445 [Alphaproteobacteria bacterium 46_93_T64]|nr:hypothetical protein A9Q83_12445 [Alphaproteobacteria bacterium 46_93_T64]